MQSSMRVIWLVVLIGAIGEVTGILELAVQSGIWRSDRMVGLLKGAGVTGTQIPG
jgi:hypothetical protein